MMLEVLTPGMQDAEQSNLSSQVLRVASVRLALGTVPVAARVIGDGLVSAAGAPVAMTAAFAASVTAIHATFVVTGTSARQLFSMPGNS